MTRSDLPVVVVVGHFPELARHLDQARYRFVLVCEGDGTSPADPAPYDATLVVDAMDPAVVAPQVLACARTPVLAVLAGRERYTVAAATLGRRLGCGPCDVSTMERFEDKAQFRRAVDAAGLSPYPYEAPAEISGLAHLVARSRHGVVVKPARGNASRGVRLVTPGTDLRVLAALVAGAGPHGLVAETYVPGRGYSVEIVRSAGETRFANVTEKWVPGPSAHAAGGGSPFVPFEHRLPVPSDRPDAAEVLDRTQRFLDVAGARSGLFHAEWQVPPQGEPHFVECAARFPGGELGAAISAVYGINLATYWIDALAHEPSGPAPLAPPGRRAAALAFAAETSGVLARIDGLDEVRSMPNVETVTVRRDEGEMVSPPSDGSERVLMVVLSAPTAQELDERAAIVRDAIRVRVASSERVPRP